MIFFILKGYPENEQNWSFLSITADLSKKRDFLLFSQMFIVFIQMSVFLHFSCTAIIPWWFSSFYKAFQKMAKIEVSDQWLQTCRKMWFFAVFTKIFVFFIQVSDFFYIKVPFCHTKMIFFIIKGFPDNGHNWSFRPMTVDVKNVIFCCFYKYSYFSCKWVNFYSFVVQLSYHDDFRHFKRLSRKWPKLKFSIDDRGPVEKCDFLLFQLMFIFFIKMNVFLHFCHLAFIPWWFSSF